MIQECRVRTPAWRMEKMVGIKERINYIHDNLGRNGLVHEQWEYVYTSAKDYQGQKGLVKIEFAF